MLVHLCESSMFQHYLTYFMGACPPATDMRTLPIVHKYVTPQMYWQTLNITIDMWQHMRRFYIGRSLP